MIAMNKEEYFKYYIQGSDHYLIPKDVFDELFNEMSNWREETKELKKQLEEYKHKGLYNTCLPYSTGYKKAIKEKENQQKEFMKWLESIKFIGIIPIEMVCDKYKKIIGGKDE